MRFYSIFLTTFVVLAMGGEIAQAADSKMAPCRLESLLGTWEMVHQSINIPVKEGNLFYAEFQLYQFAERSKFKQMGGSEPFSERDRAVFKDGVAASKYQIVDDNGLIEISLKSGDVMRVLCSMYRADARITGDNQIEHSDNIVFPKKGDLVLTYYSADFGPYLFRHFRKVN